MKWSVLSLKNRRLGEISPETGSFDQKISGEVIG
jgi:hypothetical protein